MPWTTSFYTVEPETPPVYHNNSACEDGKRVKEKNKVYGNEGRRLCERCEQLNSEGT